VLLCLTASVGAVITVSAKAGANATQWEEGGHVDDMTKLAHLHEPGVLHNLQQRYLTKTIYVWSLTPSHCTFEWLPNLYHPLQA